MANYIDNEELQAEMNKWRDSAENPDDRVPSERLGQILVTLHDGVLKHTSFRGYPQDLKDEMKSFSLYCIFKRGLKSYKFGKSTPFAYFTRSAFLNYTTVLKRYYKQLNQYQRYVKGILTDLDTKGDPKLEWLVAHFGIAGDGD